jgi:hypothetical protein
MPLQAASVSVSHNATSVEGHTFGSAWSDIGCVVSVANLATLLDNAPCQSQEVMGHKRATINLDNPHVLEFIYSHRVMSKLMRMLPT